MSRPRSSQRAEEESRSALAHGRRQRRQREQRYSHAAGGPSVADPLGRYFPILWSSKGKCCLCGSDSLYVFGIFLCRNCEDLFRQVVRRGQSLTCDEIHASGLCSFCLAEELYLYVSSLVVPGFRRRSYADDYLPLPTPEGHFSVMERLNEGDASMIDFYHHSVDSLLSWIDQQKDVYLFKASDRRNLMSMNGLAGTLIWMATVNTTIHNVVRARRRYIDPDTCASEPLRVILANILHMGMAYEELRLTPRHLYFVRLISLLRPGTMKIEKWTDGQPTLWFVSENPPLEREIDCQQLVRSYWWSLRDMNLDVEDLQRLNFAVEWSRSMAKWMESAWRDGAISYLQKFNAAFNAWLSSHRYFLNDDVVVGLGFHTTFSTSVVELCDVVNGETMKNFRLASNILADRFTKIDSDLILSTNFFKFNAAHLVFCTFWDNLYFSSPPFCTLIDLVMTVRRHFSNLHLGDGTLNHLFGYFLLFDPCVELSNNLRDCPFEKLRDLFVWNLSRFLRMDVEEVERTFRTDYSLEDVATKIDIGRNWEQRAALIYFFRLTRFLQVESRNYFPLLLNLNFWLETE